MIELKKSDYIHDPVFEKTPFGKFRIKKEKKQYFLIANDRNREVVDVVEGDPSKSHYANDSYRIAYRVNEETAKCTLYLLRHSGLELKVGCGD